MNDRHFPFAMRTWLIVGVIATILAVTALLFGQLARFLQAYLFAYLFWMEISLGCLGVALLVYLVNTSWGHLSRWILEAGTKTLWLMLLLFLPIAAGIFWLYPWANPAALNTDPLLAQKSAYLNLPFFFIRAGVYFALWIFFARTLGRMAQRPETYTDAARWGTFRKLAIIGFILYFLTATFAQFDWVMSLTPDWYSTIFGMLSIMAQGLAAFAFVLLLLPRLALNEPLKGLVTTRTYQDLGAMLLTCVLGWAYLAFSQYLIIWSGNLPHEVIWYTQRSTGGWPWLGTFVIVCQFVIPFFVLLSSRARRSPRVLAGLSVLILLMRLLDNFQLVLPAFSAGQLSLHWLDFVLPVAIGGWWMAVFVRALTRTVVFIPETAATPHPHAASTSEMEIG